MIVNLLDMGYGEGIVWRLLQGGHNVNVYLKNDKYEEKDKEVYESWGVKVITNREFKPKKNGEVWIVDDVGFGNIEAEDGAIVFSGNKFSDAMEMDRKVMYDNLKNIGIEVGEYYNFNKISDAIEFVEEEGGEWVVKLSGKEGEENKWTTKVGKSEEDVIRFLKFLQKFFGNNLELVLQEKFNGIEVAMTKYYGAYFLNFEYKNLMRMSRYKTGEMGTLVKRIYDDEDIIEASKIDRIEELLRSKGRYNIPVDVNMIYSLDEDKFYALELTNRFGYPINSIIMGGYEGDVLDIFMENEKFKEGMSYDWLVGIVIASPPYPYIVNMKDMERMSDIEVEMNWKWRMVNEGMIKVVEDENVFWRYALMGYNMVTVGKGKTISEANKRANGLIETLDMPNIFFRYDIGLLDEGNAKILAERGYIENGG